MAPPEGSPSRGSGLEHAVGGFSINGVRSTLPPEKRTARHCLVHQSGLKNLKTLLRGLLGSLFLAFQISFATFAFLYFVVLLSHDSVFTRVALKSWGI